MKNAHQVFLILCYTIFLCNGLHAVQTSVIQPLLNFNFCFELSVVQDPKSPMEYYNRGVKRYGIEDYDGAIEDFTRAIILAPNFKDAYN